MHEFSTVDGFVEITEDLGEMIKYIANEPSVGLFYVQQHAQNAVPNVINLKDNVTKKSHETVLHTEDLEDSITMVKSMKGCGYSIADEMIRDIKMSLATISAKQPKRGLIHNPISVSQLGRTRSWGPSTWGHNGVQQENKKTGTYLSTVFKNAKERASNFKWPQLDSKELAPTPTPDEKQPPFPETSQLVTSASTSLILPDVESEELPLSSQATDEPQAEDGECESKLPHIFSLSENYEDFKADKEAKLEEWLGGNGERLDKSEEGK